MLSRWLTKKTTLMSKELIKILAVDAVAIAGLALLIAFPNFVVGILLWSLVLGALFGLCRSVSRMTDEEWARVVRGLVIGYIFGRIGRGKDIL
jgi:hypothetical protein